MKKTPNPNGRPTNAARDAAVADIVRIWTAPYGGPEALPPVNLALARAAADLSLRRIRKVEDQIRQANVLSKLISQAGLASARGETLQPVNDDTDDEPRFVPGKASDELHAMTL